MASVGAKADERAQRLASEVAGLKSARVELMKRMKQAAAANRYVHSPVLRRLHQLQRRSVADR